jgi:hypothetical protein
LLGAICSQSKKTLRNQNVYAYLPSGRGNSEAIASRSLFAVDLELDAIQC